MIKIFDSIEQFALAAQYTPNHERSASSWVGHISHEEAVNRALKGDDRYVARAEKLIDELEVALPETKAFKTVHSPFGGRVNLGDWFAGSPMPIRRRVRANSDINPVNIYVSTTCSAGIDAETMEKRGTVILALLLKLQQIRPVQLYLLAETHGEPDGWAYQVIRIESQPLDIAVAAFGLCHVGFARHLTYGYAIATFDFNGRWPTDYYSAGYAERRAQRLNLKPDDIIVKETHFNDTIVKTPIKWLKLQLAKYAGMEESENV